MHLRFVSIKLDRFRSFVQPATFYFDEMGGGLYFLKGKNKTLSALGSNGSGKSTIVDALLWCLYGRTVQGLRNPDVVSWTGKGATSVSVTIKTDKTIHTIKRTINPNLLTIDDKEAGQEYVSKLIAIPFEILPYTVILGQRQPLFYDLTASEKLRLFSEVLQLERWEKRSEHAATVTKQLESEIESKTYEVASLHKQQLSVEFDFVRVKEQSQKWEIERADRIEKAEQTKTDLLERLVSVTSERDSADLCYDRAATELKAFKGILEKLWAKERPLSEAYRNAERAYTSLDIRGKMLEEQIDKISETKICPTCGQLIEDKKHFENEQKKKRVELVKIVKDYKTAVEFFKMAELAYQEIDNAIQAQLLAKDKFENDASAARDILDRLLPKIANWEAEIKALEAGLQRDTEQHNPYTEQQQTLRRRRDQNKADISKSEETIKSKTQYKEYVAYWIKGFKDIKLLQVEEILQELEITTNGMLETFGLVNWSVKYDIERETKAKTIARGLNITVLSPNNKQPVKWEVWSGGEAQRLRLIGSAALSSVLLNHVGVSTNLMACDEPTESLSREGVRDLVDLLADRAREAKMAIWLIDHHAIESDKFKQIVEVVKDKTGSHIYGQNSNL